MRSLASPTAVVAATATITGERRRIPGARSLLVVVDITAIASATSLSFTLYGTNDGGTTWRQILRQILPLVSGQYSCDAVREPGFDSYRVDIEFAGGGATVSAGGSLHYVGEEALK